MKKFGQLKLGRIMCFLIGSCLLALLTSCNPFKSKVVLDNGNQGMALPKQVSGASEKARLNSAKKLQKDGVTVLTMGQDYLVSVPSHLLFYADTPRVRWKSYAVLNDITDYLKQFRKVSVSVIAYTAKIGPETRNQSLSVARARNIANYLWSQAIDARFMTTKGMGSEKPIVNQSSSDAVAMNSRIEISFRNVIV